MAGEMLANLHVQVYYSTPRLHAGGGRQHVADNPQTNCNKNKQYLRFDTASTALGSVHGSLLSLVLHHTSWLERWDGG